MVAAVTQAGSRPCTEPVEAFFFTFTDAIQKKVNFQSQDARTPERQNRQRQGLVLSKMPCTVILEDTRQERFCNEIADEVENRSNTQKIIVVAPREPRASLLVHELNDRAVSFEQFSPSYADSVLGRVVSTFRESPQRYTLVIYNCWDQIDEGLDDLEHILINDMANIIVTVPKSATESLWLPLLKFSEQLLIHQPRTYRKWAITHIHTSFVDKVHANLEAWEKANGNVRAIFQFQDQEMTLFSDGNFKTITEYKESLDASKENDAEELKDDATADATADATETDVEPATYSHASEPRRKKRTPNVKKTPSERKRRLWTSIQTMMDEEFQAQNSSRNLRKATIRA